MTNITFLGAGLGFGVNPLNNNHYTKPAQAITTARENSLTHTYHLPPTTYSFPESYDLFSQALIINYHKPLIHLFTRR